VSRDCIRIHSRAHWDSCTFPYIHFLHIFICHVLFSIKINPRIFGEKLDKPPVSKKHQKFWIIPGYLVENRINPRYQKNSPGIGVSNFVPPGCGPALMTRGCFGALRLAAARPILLHACSATVWLLHSCAVKSVNFKFICLEARKPLHSRLHLSFLLWQKIRLEHWIVAIGWNHRVQFKKIANQSSLNQVA